jgi:hypothetical protein
VQSTVRLAVAVAVSAACLYFATRGTDWAQVLAAMRAASPLWVLAVVVVSLSTHLIRAFRWCVLLRPVGAVPVLPAFSATVIGFGASMVLPLRLGEIVRPALLARRVGIRTTAALSSVVLERLFDILLVVSCFLAVGLLYDVPASLKRTAIVLGVGVAVGFVVLVLMVRRRAQAERLIRRVLGVLPTRVGDALWPIADGLLHGLSGVADGPTVLLVLAYSAALWTAITATYTLSFLAMNVSLPLVKASLTTVVIVAAFVSMPQAPGFVGTWQAGCVLALGLFAVPRELAVGYSLLTWVVQMIVNIGAAGVFLAFEDVSVRQLVAEGERRTAEG